MKNKVLFILLFMCFYLYAKAASPTKNEWKSGRTIHGVRTFIGHP